MAFDAKASFFFRGVLGRGPRWTMHLSSSRWQLGKTWRAPRTTREANAPMGRHVVALGQFCSTRPPPWRKALVTMQFSRAVQSAHTKPPTDWTPHASLSPKQQRWQKHGPSGLRFHRNLSEIQQSHRRRARGVMDAIFSSSFCTFVVVLVFFAILFWCLPFPPSLSFLGGLPAPCVWVA